MAASDLHFNTNRSSLSVRCDAKDDSTHDHEAGPNAQETAVIRPLEAQLQEQQAQILHLTAQLEVRTRELEQANARLEALATTDGLTGLKNHRAFQEFLEIEHRRALANGAPLTLILIDLDAFKRYNDLFGHSAGDEVLKAVAHLLLRHARSSDFVARFGGEEFAIVLPATDQSEACLLAERCRAALEAIPWLERPMTASFGVAAFTAQTRDAATLAAHADLALFLSKKLGRNRVSTYEEVPKDLYASALTDALRTLEDQTNTHLMVPEIGDEAIVRQQTQSIYDATIAGWSRMLDMRDHETEGHSERVMEMTERLAMAMAMNEQDIVYARWGALLHDIGKMGVPDNILNKPGELTDNEWEVMRRHPQYAYEMLAPISFLNPALAIPWCHHEKWDGSGYPHGLSGEQIPLEARIFAIVDVYDALRSDRPYRAGWPEQQVRDYIRAHSGTHFDPTIVRAFLRMLETENPVQSVTEVADTANEDERAKGASNPRKELS